MSEPREMSVGKWDPMNPGKAGSAAEPAAARGPGPPGPNPENDPKNPLAQLIFDPWRLVPRLVKGIPLILMAGAIGGALGLAIGYLKTETLYTIQLRLVKKEMSSVFRAGRLGEAYAPPELKPATLISAVGSFSALKQVSERSGLPVPLLRGSFDFSEERKTDLMVLTVWSSQGREEVVRLANIWAEEIVDYTRQLQARESENVRVYLEEQIRGIDGDIVRIERELLEQIQAGGTVNPEKEIEAYLRSLSGLELEYHNARIELDSMQTKITALRDALRRQTPGAEKLRQLQEEYQKLLSQYTEANPLVIEARENIAQLREQVRQEQSSQEVKEDQLTGTGVGDALYLELVQLENRQRQLQHRTAELEKLLTDSRDRLRAIPEQAMRHQQLMDKKESLQSARELIFSRLQEARLFEEKAPGYLSILARATPEEVHVGGRTFKTVLAGAVLGTGFAGLAFLVLAGMEVLSPRLKTGKELEFVFGIQPAGTFPPGGELPPPADRARLWNAWMGKRMERTVQGVWLPFRAEGEDRFWTWALDEGRRLVDSVLLVDAGEDRLSLTPRLPVYNGEGPLPPGVSTWGVDLGAASQQEALGLFSRLEQLAGSRTVVWLRLTGEMHEPSASLLPRCGALCIAGDPASASRAEWRAQRVWLESLPPDTLTLIVLNQTKGIW